MSEPLPAPLAEVVPISPTPSPVPPAAAIPAPIEIPLEKVKSNKVLYWTLGILAVAGIVGFLVYKKRAAVSTGIETPTK